MKASTPAQTPAMTSTTPDRGEVVIPGEVEIRPMRSNDAGDRVELREPTLRQVMERPPEHHDEVVEFRDNDKQVWVLDLDTHHLRDRPSAGQMSAVARCLSPCPDAYWVSHGHGVKGVYVGADAERKAIVAALSAPRWLTAEVATRTRHPLSYSTQHRGGCPSAVAYAGKDESDGPVTFVGPLSDDEAREAIDALGLEPGGRYGHDRCPIHPEADTQANQCVVVLDQVVYCHRCAGHGVSTGDGVRPGIFPLRRAIRSGKAPIETMAKACVHWTHARHVLRDAHPNLDGRLLERAYRIALTQTSKAGEHDPRIPTVFDPDLRYVWGEGTWLDARTGAPIRLDEQQAKCLPTTRYLEIPNGDATRAEAKSKPLRVSNVRTLGPEDHPPIRPVRGVALHRPPGVTPVVFTPPAPKIELLRDPMPLDTAIEQLTGAFPGVDGTYIQTALAAMVCGECGEGLVPWLVVTGPSGSAKGEGLRLAGSFLGDEPIKLRLKNEDEKFYRELGTAITSGHRAIQLDELGKVRDLRSKMSQLLELGRVVHWRPLYGNGNVESVCRSAIFATSVTLPEFLLRSHEFQRRARHIRLPGKVGNWARTSGGDTAAWRGHRRENAHIANSILTHVYRMCREHEFHFGAVADELGVGHVGDEEHRLDPAVLRELYRHVCDADGDRTLFERDRTFVRGWIDVLNDPVAYSMLNALVPLEDFSDNPKYITSALKNEIASIDWGGVLGIRQPTLVCELRVHGRKIGLRFRSDERKPRGQEVLNEQLPPLPNDPPADEKAAPTPTPTHEPEEVRL